MLMEEDKDIEKEKDGGEEEKEEKRRKGGEGRREDLDLCGSLTLS